MSGSCVSALGLGLWRILSAPIVIPVFAVMNCGDMEAADRFLATAWGFRKTEDLASDIGEGRVSKGGCNTRPITPPPPPPKGQGGGRHNPPPVQWPPNDMIPENDTANPKLTRPGY